MSNLVIASTALDLKPAPMSRRCVVGQEGGLNEASLLVLGADPLTDFAAVRDIRLRVKQGAALEIAPAASSP